MQGRLARVSDTMCNAMLLVLMRVAGPEPIDGKGEVKEKEDEGSCQFRFGWSLETYLWRFGIRDGKLIVGEMNELL